MPLPPIAYGILFRYRMLGTHQEYLLELKIRDLSETERLYRFRRKVVVDFFRENQLKDFCDAEPMLLEAAKAFTF